ncbi:MAG: hypothetical protein WCB11_05895 [Terriglobales bacterium]
MTVLASKQTVEDSLLVARSIAAKWAEVDDPRLSNLQEIVRHLDDLLNSQPDQLAWERVTSVEDYFDDAKQPQAAAQVKFEVDMIAKWRREARPGKVKQQRHGAKLPSAPAKQDLDILAVDHEEPYLVLPLMSEEERQRASDRALYKAGWATRGKTLTNAEMDAWEQEYVDNLWRNQMNVDGSRVGEK